MLWIFISINMQTFRQSMKLHNQSRQELLVKDIGK